MSIETIWDRLKKHFDFDWRHIIFSCFFPTCNKLMVNLFQRISSLRPFASLSALSVQSQALTPAVTWTRALSRSLHPNSMERSSRPNCPHAPFKPNRNTKKRNHRGTFICKDMDAKGHQGRGDEEVEDEGKVNNVPRVQSHDLNEEGTAEFSGTYRMKMSSSVFYNSSFENFASLPPKMLKDNRQVAVNYRKQRRPKQQHTSNKYRNKQGSWQSQNPQFVNNKNEKNNEGIAAETQTKEGSPEILQVERPQEIIEVIPPQQHSQPLLPTPQLLSIPPLPQPPFSAAWGDFPPLHLPPHPMHNSYNWRPPQFIYPPIPIFDPLVQQQPRYFPGYPISAVQVPLPMWGHQQQGFRPIRRQTKMQQHQQTRGISSDVVFAREWEEIESVIEKQSLDFQFTVMSYNVLSPNIQLSHPEMYISHDPRAMRWDYRYACFSKEIETYDPDIVCLQEVDSANFERYNDFFFQRGYNGVYKKRTGIDKSDGCAIFYRDNRFKLEDMISVEYNQSSSEIPLLNRDNVALIAKFFTQQEPPQRLVVATTHLLFNPKRLDVKLGQTKLLLAELDRISCYGLSKQGHPLYHPTIVTGDFNAKPSSIVTRLMKAGYIHSTQIPPDRKSKVQDPSEPRIILPKNLGISDQCQHYRVLQRRTIHLNDIHSSVSNSLVHLTHSDRKWSKHNFDETIKKIVQDFGLDCSFGSGNFSHRFNFQEVYDYTDKDASQDFVTTFHHKWVQVDYMYFSTKPNKELQVGNEDNLKLLRRLKLPTRKECNRLGTIPREGVSSDHYHLMAEFLLRPTFLVGPN